MLQAVQVAPGMQEKERLAKAMKGDNGDEGQADKAPSGAHVRSRRHRASILNIDLCLLQKALHGSMLSDVSMRESLLVKLL